MKIRGILKKGLAVSLCALMLGGASVSLLYAFNENSMAVCAVGSSFDNAKKIKTNQSYTDNISQSEEIDYYQFELTDKSIISIELSHNYVEDSRMLWLVKIYKDNNSMEEVYSYGFHGTYKKEFSANIGLPKGTYYATVESYKEYILPSYSNASYNLRINTKSSIIWEQEKNNSFETANNITINKEYSGCIMDKNDKDFYNFYLSENKRIYLNFSHKYLDTHRLYWRVKLYKDTTSTYEEIKNFDFQGNKTNEITDKVNLTKGRYYVVIERYSGYLIDDTHSDVDYTFKVCPEYIAVQTITLNKLQMSLGKGETTKLTATVAPSNATNKSVTWRTSDSKVLTVDKNGNVKAVGNGTAWITAKTSNGKEKSCKITVKNAPNKVTISKGVVTIGVGEKFTVGSAVPDGSAAAKRTYRTSNSSIVKMTRTDWQGDFVGVKPGTAYVTVRTYNGKESTCKVTVKAAPSSVTISKKTMTMKVGQTATLSCSVPSDAGCATRTYRTSNSSVVKMTKTSWTGTFKALKKGTAYVTVRTYNGKESSCKIEVK